MTVASMPVRASRGLTFLAGSAFALTACSSAVTAKKMDQVQTGMKIEQVEAILGKPARIDQSETTGLRGAVYHYPAEQGEGRVVFVNDAVFKSTFVPGAKS